MDCSGKAMSQDFVKSTPILGDNPKAHFTGKSFMKSSGFQWNLADFIWNPADFTWHLHEISKHIPHFLLGFNVESIGFYVKSTVKSIMKTTMKPAVNNEICIHLKSINWNPQKSTRFHMKSAGFHEIQQILKDHLPGMVTLCLSFYPLHALDNINCLKYCSAILGI